MDAFNLQFFLFFLVCNCACDNIHHSQVPPMKSLIVRGLGMRLYVQVGQYSFLCCLHSTCMTLSTVYMYTNYKSTAIDMCTEMVFTHQKDNHIKSIQCICPTKSLTWPHDCFHYIIIICTSTAKKCAYNYTCIS